MSSEPQKGMFAIDGINPMRIEVDVSRESSLLSIEQRHVLERVGTTVKAYLKAAQDLLDLKHRHLRDLAPQHLLHPGNVLAASCTEGVVVRYERRSDDSSLTYSGWVAETLAETVSMLSQRVVHCYPNRDYTSRVPTVGHELTLFAEDGATGERRSLLAAKFGLDAVIERPASPS